MSLSVRSGEGLLPRNGSLPASLTQEGLMRRARKPTIGSYLYRVTYHNRCRATLPRPWSRGAALIGGEPAVEWLAL